MSVTALMRTLFMRTLREDTRQSRHCFKSYFFRLAVSKCFVIHHWHVCDRSHTKCVLNQSQNCLWLNNDFFLCVLSQTCMLLQCCMTECSVITWGKGWLLGSRSSSGGFSRRRLVWIPPCLINYFESKGWLVTEKSYK